MNGGILPQMDSVGQIEKDLAAKKITLEEATTRLAQLAEGHLEVAGAGTSASKPVNLTLAKKAIEAGLDLVGMGKKEGGK